MIDASTIDLALIKKQARIEPGDMDDDDTLRQQIAAALSHIEMHCDRVLVDAVPTGPHEMALTPDVWQAMAMLVAHWYANRETAVVGNVTPAQVPFGFERLLQYRKRF